MTDHVFKDTAAGLAFVGDFDGLYASQPDPWAQSCADAGQMTAFYLTQRSDLILALHEYGVQRACEIGCGHGYLTTLLTDELPEGALGVDVSVRAIQKARELHPECEFVVGDICHPRFDVLTMGVDCVIWANCLWYVLHALDHAVHNTLSMLEQDELFVVSQGFLRDEQRYGREIMNGFAGTVQTMIARYGNRMQLVEALYDSHSTSALKDGMLIFRKL